MTANPYEPPKSDSEKPTLDRRALSGLIREMLDTSPDIFAIAEKVECFQRSPDPTCRLVSELLVDYCDDELGGANPLTKSEWDCLQRFLLILDAKCELKEETQRDWGWTHGVAAVGLVAFLITVVLTGIGYHLLVATSVLSVLSMLLAYKQSLQTVAESPYSQIIFPFATFSDLSRCYHSTRFRKERYPKHLRGLAANEASTSQLMLAISKLCGVVMWLVCSPLILLFQSLPDVDCKVVAVPADVGIASQGG